MATQEFTALVVRSGAEWYGIIPDEGELRLYWRHNDTWLHAGTLADEDVLTGAYTPAVGAVLEALEDAYASRVPPHRRSRVITPDDVAATRAALEQAT